MDIMLNGERRTMPDRITVSILLELLNIQHQRVAVELNREIVKKDRYGSTAIKDGDSIEVVSFMQGGCDTDTAAQRSMKTPHPTLSPRGRG
jgi:thiamine biosynthesis protein ThiS